MNNVNQRFLDSVDRALRADAPLYAETLHFGDTALEMAIEQLRDAWRKGRPANAEFHPAQHKAIVRRPA